MVRPYSGEEIMTVVVAMKESDDAILIASDSEVTNEGNLKSSMRKLMKVREKSVVWASSGNPDIGIDEFGRWIRQYQWEGTTWDTFISDAADELSRLNGKQRERTKLAGIEVNEEKHLSNLVIVGWLDRPEIFTISSDGTKFSFWESGGFIAAGTGGPPAFSMFNVLLHTNKFVRTKIMRLIMEVVVSTAPNCGPPVECWRVTKKGTKSLFSFASKIETIPSRLPA